MRLVAVTFLLLSSVWSFGESKSCLSPSLVVPDGRVVNSPQFEGSFNGYNPVYWYAFYGQALHSYSVEFVPTIDNENTSASISFVNLTAWGPSDISGLQSNGCYYPSTLSFTANQAFAPTLARSKY